MVCGKPTRQVPQPEVRRIFDAQAERPGSMTTQQHQKREALERRERGEETLAETGGSYNVSGWTISRLTV